MVYFSDNREELYGEVIRNIRIAKGYSLEEVSEGIMSYSLLSKFERGSTIITVDKFIKILEKLDISLHEFELIINNYKEAPMPLLFNNIKRLYNEKNLFLLKRLEQKEDSLYKVYGEGKYKLNSIVINILLDIVTHQKKVSEVFIEELTEYLFSTEQWTHYDLYLYSFSLPRLNIQTILVFSKELLKKPFLYTDSIEFKRMIIKIILNTIFVCLKSSCFEESLFFLDAIRHHVETGEFICERAIFKYLKGCFYLKTGEYVTGKKMMEETILIIKYFDEEQVLEYIKEQFVI